MVKKETKPNIFYNKDFVLLFLGGFISRIGSKIHYVAVTWYILELTGSGTATGTLLLLSTLPGVLLGPFGGVMADRINRKFLIVGMDVSRGLIALWLGWIIYTGGAGFLHLAVATVLISISSSFFNPAVDATLPNLVDDRNLQQANSYRHFNMQFTAIIGAAVGGILISIFGVSGVIIFNGVSYLVSAFSELFIWVPNVEMNMAEKTGFIEDMMIGGKFIYNDKTLFTLFGLSMIVNFLFSGVMAVGLPFVFKQILEVKSSLYGFSQSVFPAGAVIGTLIISFLPEIRDYFKVLLWTASLQTLALFCLGIPLIPGILNNNATFTIYLILLGILVFFGFVNAINNIPINVLLQRIIPDHLRGRIFGLLSTLNQGLVPISMAFIGWLLDIVSAYILFMVSSSMLGVLIICSFRLKALRQINTRAREVSIDNQSV